MKHEREKRKKELCDVLVGSEKGWDAVFASLSFFILLTSYFILYR